MQRYESYKPVDDQWLGEIPARWNVAFLSALFDEHKEKNVGMKCTNLLSLSYGRVKKKDINTTSGLLPASFETYNIIGAGDIVLRLTDLQNDQRSLRTGLCKQSGIITSAYVTLRKRNDDINSDYYHYFLHSFDTHKCFYGMGEGVRQNLSYEGISKLTLLVPPTEEQEQIVKYLDWKTSQINELIAANKRQIDLLVEYMNAAFARARSKAKKFVKLKNLVRLEQDYISPEPDEYYQKAGMYNRGRGIFTREAVKGRDLGDSKFQKVLSDHVMISGQFAWEDATYVTTKEDEVAIASHRYYLLKVMSAELRPEYIWAYFMSDEGFMQLNICSHGSAGRNRPLNINELLNSVEIPMPDSEDDLRSVVDVARLVMAFRTVDKQKTALWDEYKTVLISDVVTGKLDVRNIEVPSYDFVSESDNNKEENENEEVDE
ncbi:MAG: hypothetical protein HFJ00_14025 [Lachnospiraceae bacterium]|jgi:type I restriction enzyme S subunit|nr:hypothetical protein [Lachnospiraceae bacterium]